MHYFGVTLLASILMLSIFFDVLRFPLLRKDRGSFFFAELTVAFSFFIVLSMVLMMHQQGYIAIPLGWHRLLWALHALGIPFLLSTWMHFNAINVMDDQKQVTMLSLVHDIPLVIVAVAVLLDIPKQTFYPLNDAYLHMLPGAGSNSLLAVSWFFCFAMLMPTLGHRKNLQGSFFFLSMLLPFCFAISLVALHLNHSTALFITVNAFMMVLYYLVGQRDSITFDSLTGLPTQALLERKLIRLFRYQAPYALILMEIENFPYFNSRYGSATADLLLGEVGRFLKTLASSNEVFHLDSNRFCLCIPAKESRVAGSTIQAIRNRLVEGWNLGDDTIFMQMNIGLLLIPKQASNLAEYAQARKRVFSEISSVRKRPVFIYSKEEALGQQQKLNIISALRASIRNPKQVKVHYQPIYDVQTGRMVSAEALMRIEDEHLGFLNPSQFIHLAEQSGLIVHLTRILLAKVCTLMRENFLQETLEYISVNLSGEDFESSQVSRTLLSIIESEHVAYRHIGFEITESVVLQSYEMVSKVMLELSLKDIKFALDDFGTGYSNLQALMDLPYSYVKFDKSVIQGAAANPTMLTLLSEMLHKMGKILIAEGVETQDQLAMIRTMGIERVQGFYFSKPLDEGDFLALVG